jgi:hypothetical protein
VVCSQSEVVEEHVEVAAAVSPEETVLAVPPSGVVAATAHTLVQWGEMGWLEGVGTIQIGKITRTELMI